MKRGVVVRENVDIDLHGLTLVLVAGMWLGGIFLSSLLPLPSLSLLIGVGAALICIIPLWHDRQGRLVMVLVLCLLLGAWRYSIASPNGDPQNIAAYIGANSIEILGTVSQEPEVQGHARILTITVSTVSKNNGLSWQDAHGQLTILTLGTLIEDPYKANYGDSVEFQGKLQAPSSHSPPGIFASMAFPRISVQSTNGNPVIAFLYHLRVTLSTIITQSLPQPAAALLIAILLSLRTPALQPLIPYFNATGTAHLIAPSGFKVTILAGLVNRNTQWFYKNRNPQGQKLLPAQKRDRWQRWLATILIMASITAYTLLSGAGPAALRSGIMGILLVIAPRIGRTYNIYTALALTVLLMSMINPFILWDTGFLLSVLGTLGIVLLTPFFQRLLSPLEHLPFGHSLVEIIAVTSGSADSNITHFCGDFPGDFFDCTYCQYSHGSPTGYDAYCGSPYLWNRPPFCSTRYPVWLDGLALALVCHEYCNMVLTSTLCIYQCEQYG